MRLLTLPCALLALASQTQCSTIPHRQRDIPNPGQHTMRGNISAIASWTYAALAYATISTTNTTELSYLCANAAPLSSRYLSAFPETSGDVSKFAREAICNAARTPPSPSPLWYMKSYLAAAFTAQSYYGDRLNTTYYAQLCWFVESSLLAGVWVPCADTQESGVDAEGSFCASAGYYDKGDYSWYTNATQTGEVVGEAGGLVSRVMARVVGVVLGSERQREWVCGNLGRFAEGLGRIGLKREVVEEEVCGRGKGVVEVQKARGELLSAMTDLFAFQLLKGGSDRGYPKFLCEGLKKDGLAQVGLDGARVVESACNAASHGQQ
ncbi:hypothetical protein EJ04DRAFT_553038 [Polyplosphaeria fusca]|uniref:Uncharacterized protein n=1 Tax=Polyplosphaeria fusca TaxID=682080 RepID=A0A9P4QZL4_9PLEO|nr:hypothetical protein EJ04DRAFT_553038 [Polyplosphaeria fusca]